MNHVNNKSLIKSKQNEPLMISGNKYGILLLHGFTSGPHEMRPVSDALIHNIRTLKKYKLQCPKQYQVM